MGADVPAFGSFERWAALVAGAVRTLMGVDVCDVITRHRQSDPLAAAERRLFRLLAKHFGERPWKVAEAIDALPADIWGELGIKTGSEGRPHPRTLTAWLRRHREAVRGPYALFPDTDRHATTLWRLNTRPAEGAETPNSPDSALIL
ncbi:MAG TPA: hypothetical protein ENJ38_00250 [Rhodospirillales bacterium]|nr:hypothetical protein [Rhodospirillales bacterium]